jgi:hypothetical protein
MRLLTPFVIAILVTACTASPPPRKAAATPPAETIKVSEVNKDLLKKGYKVVKRDGKIGYCRAEQMTGTQFKKTICLTEDQIREQARRTTETSDSMERQRWNPGCIHPPCG